MNYKKAEIVAQGNALNLLRICKILRADLCGVICTDFADRADTGQVKSGVRGRRLNDSSPVEISRGEFIEAFEESREQDVG